MNDTNHNNTEINGDDIDIKKCDKNHEEDCHTEVESSVGSESSNDDISSELTPQQKIESLEQQVNELNDKFLRAQAEMQNRERRNIEEVRKARDYAISKFAGDIVIVKDYLEMALKDQSGNFEMLKMGVDLTLKQLIQVFDNHKVKTIEPKVGDKLDPNHHQAVDTVENSDIESGSIVEILQKGYLLSERVLRPAMVKVAK